jgi:hypothetical protein
VFAVLQQLQFLFYTKGLGSGAGRRSVVKSAKAGLREQEVRRTEIPRAERRLAVQAKRSGEKLLASN